MELPKSLAQEIAEPITIYGLVASDEPALVRYVGGNYHLTAAGRNAIIKALKTNEERKRKIAESKRRMWQDPQYRERMLAHMKDMTSKSQETFARRRGDFDGQQ